MPRLICTALRFEGYNRGDLIDERHTERFLGRYPHQVAELTDEDLAEYEKAKESGTVGKWIDAMCGKPTVAALRKQAEAPEPHKPQTANARKPKPAPVQKKAPAPIAAEPEGDE
jgi:hypothetical protein